MIPVGPLQSNCYLVYDETSRDAIVIDPGDEPGRMLKAMELQGVKVTSIVCTHAHFDHVGGVKKLKEKTGATICLHQDDLPVYERVENQGSAWGFLIEQPPHPDRLLREGDEIPVGRYRLTVLHTPGHSPGSICLFGEGVLFTGDTVFAGSIGRTDFPGGSLEAMKSSFRRIMRFPPEIVLYPGHGNWSTVADERRDNFFMHEIGGL